MVRIDYLTKVRSKRNPIQLVMATRRFRRKEIGKRLPGPDGIGGIAFAF